MSDREPTRQKRSQTVRECKTVLTRRRRVALGIAAAAVAAGALAAWRLGVLFPGRRAGGRAGGHCPTPVTDGRDPAGHRGQHAADRDAGVCRGPTWCENEQGGGTLTWLPRPGQVVSQGQALYRTGNGSPVALLYGSVPDWRSLGEGDDRRRTCPS